MREADLPDWIMKTSATGLLVLMTSILGWPQEPASPHGDTVSSEVRQLHEEVRELRAAIAELRSESAQYRAETAELRRELQAHDFSAMKTTAPPEPNENVAPATTPEAASTSSQTLEGRVASLEESSRLLSGKVDEQHQTKVESASKYHVRLSGLVLFDLFSNHGAVDNQDFPSYAGAPTAYGSHGSFAASLRQSELGLEVFGPRIAGAKTTGNIQVDFAGGLANTLNGANYGLLRLRAANLRMDWERTSIVAGQDSVFLSPLSPTSLSSLAVPAFGYAGNLWGWLPQVRVEHRFDLNENQRLTLQGGILDNFTGEPPYSQYNRGVQAGERSSQPGFGARMAWSRNVFGLPLTIGTAGYYSRQNWGFDRYDDGWAGMADWEVPLAQAVSLTGEFYRGKAIGGLAGGIGRSILFSGDPLSATTQIRPFNSTGGWAQLKWKINPKLEINGAAGLDNSFAADLRAFPVSQSYYDPTLAQNRNGLLNFIYHPRSNLLFSAEYKHLRTTRVDGNIQSAEQVNLLMGVLF